MFNYKVTLLSTAAMAFIANAQSNVVCDDPENPDYTNCTVCPNNPGCGGGEANVACDDPENADYCNP